MAVTSAYALKATIFGARGSLPNPSAATEKYGGATTCLGIETPDHIPIVIDGGSGVFDLGLALSGRDGVREVHMFFTHTHWDHVQGLPFFIPFYDASWRIHIYSLSERRVTVREIFEGVYAERFFPVPFDRLGADIVFHELPFEAVVHIGSTVIKSCRVNHPGYALGFRVDHADRSLFFASDAAPFVDMLFGDRFHHRQRETDPEVIEDMARLQGRMEALMSGVDLLFHDANYTDEEYENLYHFGHASMSQACRVAKRCGARHLVLWHHDRSRTDPDIDMISAPFTALDTSDELVVEPARQGTAYQLPLGTKNIVSVNPPK